MNRDPGQTTASRCFAECEREQFQKRIAELDAVLEALWEENQDLRLQLITELVPDGYKEKGDE